MANFGRVVPRCFRLMFNTVQTCIREQFPVDRNDLARVVHETVREQADGMYEAYSEGILE